MNKAFKRYFFRKRLYIIYRIVLTTVSLSFEKIENKEFRILIIIAHRMLSVEYYSVCICEFKIVQCNNQKSCNIIAHCFASYTDSRLQFLKI